MPSKVRAENRFQRHQLVRRGVRDDGRHLLYRYTLRRLVPVPERKRSSMNVSSGPPAVDSSVNFIDPIWLQAVGGVREENALEYFSRSPFFYRADGIEFVLEKVLPHATGPAFVIRRQRRRGSHAEPEAYFYILMGAIYQCPSIYEVMTSRVDKMSFFLKRAYKELENVRRKKQQEKDDEYVDPNNSFPDMGPNLLEDLLYPPALRADQIRIKYNLDPYEKGKSSSSSS
mmetsp:Transcript_1484/g.4386  ORF Transcript_1484/g.4386 Transcript_1484/m.4386 type:complete len:229 (-) Transcript_1484:152-838(-)